MKRFLFIFLCLVVAVSLFVVIASAAYEGESAAIRFGDASTSGTDTTKTVVNMNTYDNYLWSFLEVYQGENRSLIRDGFATDWTDTLNATSNTRVVFKVAPFAPPTAVTSDRPDANYAYPTGGMENIGQSEVITLNLTMRIGADAPTNASARSFYVLIYYSGSGDDRVVSYPGTFVSANSSGGNRYYVGTFEFRRSMLTDAIGFIPVFQYDRTGTEVQTEFSIDLAVTKFTLTMPTYLYEDILGIGGPALPEDISPVLPPVYDDLNDFVVDEDELLNDTDGSDDYSNMYNNFKNAWDDFGPCLMFFSAIMTDYILLDGISGLVQISLYLGMTAFILSVGGVVVSVIRRKKE